MGWITQYDKNLRIPLWTAYKLTQADLSQIASRQDCFRVDSRLSQEDAALCSDYDDSLVHRGHMVPIESLRRSQTFADNSFLLSNMAPQYANFNSGIWKSLETRVRTWVNRPLGLYIISGAVFDRNRNDERDRDDQASRLPPNMRIGFPTHFYKIILNIRPNGTIDVIAFLLPHNIDRLAGTTNEYLTRTIVSIDKIEDATGIDFLPDLPASRQTSLESQKANGLGMWVTN